MFAVLTPEDDAVRLAWLGVATMASVSEADGKAARWWSRDELERHPARHLVVALVGAVGGVVGYRVFVGALGAPAWLLVAIVVLVLVALVVAERIRKRPLDP